MRHHIVTIAYVCSIAAIAYAVPLPANNQELDILQIPLSNEKELDILSLDTNQLTDRNKRTIGLLRELFPDITKQIDEQANLIISKFLRVLGPTVLRTAIQGNTANRARTNFNADFDDDDDDGDNTSDSASSSSGRTNTGTRVSIELPTFSPEVDDADNETDSDASKSSSTGTTTSTEASGQNNQSGGATDSTFDLSTINKQLEETIRVARQASEAESTAQNQEVTLSNEVQVTTKDTKPNEQQTVESKAPAIDELSLDSKEDAIDVDDRNKRFLAFGGTPGAAGAGAAGGAGSGNFLFDIVRLFSGSVQTQPTDEAANDSNSVGDSTDDAADSDTNRAADGYVEGIPGPVTRMVVLANRGIANLIQDLILRIAATSERLVNFKAKLITALI